MSERHILALDARITAVEKKLRQMQGQRDQLLEALEEAQRYLRLSTVLSAHAKWDDLIRRIREGK